MCKFSGKRLRYAIWPTGLREGSLIEGATGEFIFGTPKGKVKVTLEVADKFMPLSQELFDAARHLIDGDLAKTYAKVS